jgi:hypothetical protein
LLASGCGGGAKSPSVANVGAASQATTAAVVPPRPQSGPTPTSYAQQLAFAECMRSHGVSTFPDPSSKSGFTSSGSASSINHDSPQFIAANAACQHLLPAGPPPVSNQQRLQQGLKIAECMRAHGIHDFPDPTPQGGLQITGKGDLNPANAQFQAAQNACQSLQPRSLASSE